MGINVATIREIKSTLSQRPRRVQLESNTKQISLKVKPMALATQDETHTGSRMKEIKGPMGTDIIEHAKGPSSWINLVAGLKKPGRTSGRAWI